MEFPNRKENIKLLHFGVLNGKIILQVATPATPKKDSVKPVSSLPKSQYQPSPYDYP